MRQKLDCCVRLTLILLAYILLLLFFLHLGPGLVLRGDHGEKASVIGMITGHNLLHTLSGEDLVTLNVVVVVAAAKLIIVFMGYVVGDRQLDFRLR